MKPTEPVAPTTAAPDYLERAYLEQYLQGLGFSLASLANLPEQQATQLMKSASLYASMRLAEVETRSHLVEDMHGGEPPV